LLCVVNVAIGASIIAVWVVKIGGSLAGNARLTGWLTMLSTSKHTIIIVPGGGAFADQVRTMQSRWRFSDKTAHHMAILAMQQFALMLADLQSSFECCSLAMIKKKLHSGFHSMIWMPSIQELDVDKVIASWDVSSDSLAAWLAAKLHADRLVLIKSADLSNFENASIENLQAESIVDQAFHMHIEAIDCPVTIMGCDQLDKFLQLE
jgi:aspartokinase-like uncharacterized kinase